MDILELRNKLLALAGKMRSHHAKPATPEGHQEFINFATEVERIADQVRDAAYPQAKTSSREQEAQQREAQRQSYNENDQRRRAG